MRDTSIFQGWKELKNSITSFKFEKVGTEWWRVYRLYHGTFTNYFVFCGCLSIIPHESNIKLFNRAFEFTKGTNYDHKPA